ncbi:MAG: hypothetical protein KJT03_08040, partial [Verrucomicrobiae bacterium]|nr:hypothetical protein [Verrucomicrobiae bacterium]
RMLVDTLKASATTQKLIKLRCRRDFPAHSMWGKLGFIPLEERPGRSEAGHPLTLWCCNLAQDDELGLWQAGASEDTLDVVIDAQIFFDFDEPDAPNTLISKGLQNDFLVDSLNLWITDELYLEIDRNNYPEKRQRSLDRANGFYRVHYDQLQFQGFRKALKSVLPYSSRSEKSDIHHLAKTAASGVKVFVTKDEGILKFAKDISELCGVDVLHPVALISSLYEETDNRLIGTARVSGLQLCWRQASSSDIDSLSDINFQKTGESKGKLRELVMSFVVDPITYKTELLFSGENIVAFRVIDRSKSDFLRVPLARVNLSDDVQLYSVFLIADTLSSAVSECIEAVEFYCEGTASTLDSFLISMGFIRTVNSFIRISIADVCNRNSALRRIRNISPEAAETLNCQDDASLERACAPLILQKSLPCFLVPIRPSYAMGLIDREQSAEDLFGGDPTVLLRWDNIYYRAKNRHRMLTGPARILWYVSENIGEVIAISHLDEVECGLPKDLFRKYRKFGILEWRNIYELCGKDINVEIMAIKFSLTFSFRHRVSLKELRSIFSEEDIGLSLQAPLRLPESVTTRIFELAFPQS